MTEALALLAGLLLGALLGLCANVRRTRWCGRCGDTLTCPSCVPTPARRWVP